MTEFAVCTSEENAKVDLQGIRSSAAADVAGASSRPGARVGQKLRKLVSGFMVRVHQIPRDLADAYVAEMDDEEIERRLWMYARVRLCSGMELSAVGRTNQSRLDFYQVFESTTATARQAALNPVPDRAGSEAVRRATLPELEAKNLVRRPIAR